MADQEKPFDTTSIVLLLLVSGISDVSDFATLLFFPVPIIGQIVFLGNSLLVSPIVWAIIQFSFIMKTGMGRASLVAVAGGLGNMANIPGSETITTLIGIAIANNPKMSQVASLGAKAEGKGGAVSQKATAGEAGKGAGAAEAEAKTASATKTKRESGTEQEEIAGSRAAKKSGGGGQENEISPEALGEKPETMEELQRKLLNETPLGENVRIDDRNNEVDLRKR